MIPFYDKTRGTHGRGLRADQPAVADVWVGSLYFVTDENVLERSNGTTWESYSAAVVSPFWTTITNSDDGTENNWNPSGVSGNTYIEWTGSADLIITGIEGGIDGQLLAIANNDTAQNIFFEHQNGSSDPDNVLRNIATSAATGIGPGGVAIYLYNGAEWRLVSHIQGSAITSAFDAANFAATNVAGTWTVGSGDVASMSYYLDGKNFTIYINLNTTTWAGAWNRLNIDNAAFGGFTLDLNANFSHVGYLFDAGNTTSQMFIEGADPTKIGITRFDNANFTAAVNLFYIRGVLTTAVT